MEKTNNTQTEKGMSHLRLTSTDARLLAGTATLENRGAAFTESGGMHTRCPNSAAWSFECKRTHVEMTIKI